MDYMQKIIDYCLKNRVSTTEISDALGKLGVFPKVQPITYNNYKVGPVRCIFTANNSNFAVHEQIRNVKEGEVVIIFTHNCEDHAIFGDLVSKYILLYRGAVAIVVQGLLRDVSKLRRESYAIWSEGITPLGCYNTESAPYPSELEEAVRLKYDGAIAVCDDGGVTVIPKTMINADMLSRLHLIEMQEDIWSFCLNTLKWDTKKIVCDKAYLDETDLLSSIHIKGLKNLTKSLDDEKLQSNTGDK